MAEVNHAWQVLGDASRRQEYDLSLREPVAFSGTPSPAASTRPMSSEPAFNPLARYQDPPRFPWKLMGVLALVGAAFVLLGVATAGNPKPPVVDNVLEPGDCVAIQANGDAAERLCSEPHDAVVELLVSTGETCPGASEAHRDQQGMGTACVRRI